MLFNTCEYRNLDACVHIHISWLCPLTVPTSTDIPVAESIYLVLTLGFCVPYTNGRTQARKVQGEPGLSYGTRKQPTERSFHWLNPENFKQQNNDIKGLCPTE